MAAKYLQCLHSQITKDVQCLMRYRNHNLLNKRTFLTLRKPQNNGSGFIGPFPKRCFQTSAKRSVGPFAWVIIRPVSQIVAVLFGRGVRKWWQGLPANKREYFRSVLMNNWPMVLVASGTIVAGGYVYYDSHQMETPITHRRRYMAFTHEQIMKVTGHEAQTLLEKFDKEILPANHPLYTKVINIVTKLVHTNKDIEQMKDIRWKISIIEGNDINAFVLPTGNIFVFTGLIDFTNNDQLAVVLGHEMAHALLSHAAEQLSFAQFLDVIIIVVMAAIWAIMPSDGIAIVTHWFYDKVMKIMLRAPYSRKLEKEADKVGLQLAAKACFDVREGTVFWQNMEAVDKLDGVKNPEWLSTHPSHDNRTELLEFLMEQAIKTRIDCKCPPLPKKDPRLQAAHLHKHVNNIVIGKQAGQNLKRVKKFTHS